MTETEYIWTIVAIRDETPNVHTLVLDMPTQRPDFIAGQYLTIKLPGHDPIEGKAYSISSASYEKQVHITIKKMGAYSSALLAKKVGDTLCTSAPYGFFYPEPEDVHELIFLAGGIGITPCMSIIQELCHAGDTRPIHVFYSNQTLADVTFLKQLTTLERKYSHVSVHTYITRETDVPQPHSTGRMSIPSVLQTLPNPSLSTFFLCGDMHFTRDLWKALRNAGIPPEKMYTEGFF